MRFLYLYLLCVTIVLISCQNTPSEPPINPYEGLGQGPDEVIPPPDTDPQSFAGIHRYILKPTCANSGCHDGTFEPDYRTIESSYNTLVLHPVIKNNPAGTFSVRVQPGKPEASVLWERLNRDIDGQSGIMPLTVDPDSDWPEKRNEHLANIRTWIEAGAPDMFGNLPAGAKQPPRLLGMQAYRRGGTTPLDRDGGVGEVEVPAGTDWLEIWVAVAADNLPPTDLTYNQIKVSSRSEDFDNISGTSLTVTPTPRIADGLFAEAVPHYHHTELNISGLASGTYFVRVYVQDPDFADPTEIPAAGSQPYVKRYMAFRIP